MNRKSDANKFSSFSGQSQVFIEMLKLAWKADGFDFIVIILIDIILSFIPLGQAWISKKIFDLLAEGFLNTSWGSWDGIVSL